MDIEQLTKSQIVLLTLLVSFITSIATGIVTVTLMDQAPAAVTQTINRVVERTVERVVPGESQVASPGEIIKEVTVVVKENDLITDAISKNGNALVRINRKDERATDGVGALAGIGFFVRADGVVATDPALLLSRETYILTTPAGVRYEAKVIPDTLKTAVGFLKVVTPTGGTFPSVSFAGVDTVKLGQTAISLSGATRTNVAMGIVTDVEILMEPEALVKIRTDIADHRVEYGSPLFNMFGEVVGIHVAKVQTPGMASYMPLSAALSVLPATL